MLRLLQYYGKYQSARGAWGGMPGWARVVLLIAALPGLLLLLLSMLAFCVSLLALLLLTVPVYRLLGTMTGSRPEAMENVPPGGVVDFVEPAEPVQPSTEVGGVATVVVETGTVDASHIADELPKPRRQIEVRIVE